MFKDKRIEKGYSQQDVADCLGHSSCQMISNIERGLSAYPKKDFKKISILFGITEQEVKETVFEFRTKQLKKRLGLK